MIKNTPKLRFNEYSDNWIECPLSDLANLARGKFSVRPRNDPRYFGGNIPFIQTSDIVKSSIYVEQYSQTLNELGLKVSKVFPVGTIMITIAANIGDVAILKYPMACPDSLVGIEAKEFVTNNIWLMYSLFLKKDELESLATQNAQKNINLQILNSLNIFIPAYQEQKKMAQFLLSVDKKITLQSRKVQLLQQYKKGMIQNLFSQKIRFKDDGGNDFQGWITFRLSEIGKSFNGLTGKTAKDFGKGADYITYKQIFDDRVIDVTKFEKVKIDANENQSTVKFGDSFFTTSSETPNEVGFSSTLLEELLESTYLNSFCFGFRPDSFDKLLPEFSPFLFANENFRKNVILLAQGSTRFNISKNKFMEIKVDLPSIEEQRKIANFLSSVDDKITIENNKLDKLKQWKQGLLQQMFV